MKNLFLILLMLSAVALVSCGEKAETTAETTAVEAPEVAAADVKCSGPCGGGTCVVDGKTVACEGGVCPVDATVASCKGGSCECQCPCGCTFKCECAGEGCIKELACGCKCTCECVKLEDGSCKAKCSFECAPECATDCKCGKS